MIIECPAPGCAHRFMGSGAPLGFAGGRFRQASTVNCPSCGQVIQFGLLIRDDGEVWRVSRFAGHADDVRLSEPPGGDVSYQLLRVLEAGEAIAGLAEAELRARQRALWAIDGNAQRVGAEAKREAVELALELGVLDDDETDRARSWLRQE
jgi:hypothetical protein